MIILKENSRTIINQAQVAEIFNDYFTNITDRLTIDSYTPFQHQSHASCLPMNSIASKSFTFHLTNHHEVGQILNDIKANKAQGYDLIPPCAVKAVAPLVSEPLSDLINTIIAMAEVPKGWKYGQITPLHKKDSVLDKANFRPVTVLPAFDKVFERIVHTQMSGYFDAIFHDFTFAYWKLHGCSATLLTLTKEWKEKLDQSHVIGAATLDLSKAFDCIPHDLLLEKLRFYGLDERSWSLLQSYTSYIATNESNWETFFHRGMSFVVVYPRGQY